MGLSFIGIFIGVLLVVGLGMFVVWLVKQAAGAKNSLGEARERQAAMERDLEDDTRNQD